MRYRVILTPEAVRDYENLLVFHRAAVRDAFNSILKHEPTKVSKSRIKRLRDMEQPQYRMRVGDVRVFYDVSGDEVVVLAIVSKKLANDWLRKRGRP